MSYIYTFDEKRKPIYLETEKVITDETLENIEVLINYLERELNHNISESSARRFNDAKINFPVILEEVFLDYLVENIIVQNEETTLFKPFLVPDEEKRAINAIIIVDQSSSTAVKAADVKFNSLKMLDAFILNKISDYLVENSVKDFLIQREDNYIAVGNSTWNAKFKTENIDETVNLKLKNEAIKIIDYTRLDPDDSPVQRFGALHDDFVPVVYILHGNNLDFLTAVKNMMKSFGKRTKIQEVSNKYKISITTITKDKKIERFDPIKR